MRRMKLDKIDRRILRDLQGDGRITNVELARRVGVSAPPCLRRMRALEQAGYVKGYRALLDEKALGCEVLVVSNAVLLVVLLTVGGLGYALALWKFCRRDLPAPL